jgi:hypothetical protein
MYSFFVTRCALTVYVVFKKPKRPRMISMYSDSNCGRNVVECKHTCRVQTELERATTKSTRYDTKHLELLEDLTRVAIGEVPLVGGSCTLGQ